MAPLRGSRRALFGLGEVGSPPQPFTRPSPRQGKERSYSLRLKLGSPVTWGTSLHRCAEQRASSTWPSFSVPTCTDAPKPWENASVCYFRKTEPLTQGINDYVSVSRLCSTVLATRGTLGVVVFRPSAPALVMQMGRFGLQPPTCRAPPNWLSPRRKLTAEFRGLEYQR